MPAFDDICILEDQIQKLGLEIGRSRDALKTYSRKHLDARSSILTVEKNIELLRANVKDLKSTNHPVVLLSEYENAVAVLAENLELIKAKKLELKRLEQRSAETKQALPALEAQLAQAQKKLKGFCQVIPFRR